MLMWTRKGFNNGIKRQSLLIFILYIKMIRMVKIFVL